eukprot:scaffold219516_cov31-Tisochrysis_lutea.AAC.5
MCCNRSSHSAALARGARGPAGRGGRHLVGVVVHNRAIVKQKIAYPALAPRVIHRIRIRPAHTTPNKRGGAAEAAWDSSRPRSTDTYDSSYVECLTWSIAHN